jgi:hypothetical protein
MIERAAIQYQHLNKLRKSQGSIGKQRPDEVPIELWTSIHEAQLQACRAILTNKEKTHAVCEVRERKRNSTLGLLPTVSELYEIITAPEPNTRPQFASDKTGELIETFEPEVNLSR